MTAISKYSNNVIGRHKLLFKMPATDWPKWAQGLLQQAKRSHWEDYGPEQATLDAMLYQCPN